MLYCKYGGNIDMKDYLYVTDDDGKVVGKEEYRGDGVVHVYSSDDGFSSHSHDIYSSMDKYMDDVDNVFAGYGSNGGDIASRRAEENPEKHPWEDRDGVL